MSARSRSDFGGGGHRAAAGVRYPGPLAEAEPAVLDAVRAAMDESEVESSRVEAVAS